ncbi:hypothetical protein FRC03_006565 [Tulasnella sp. 419]|nr:hypothetical protein FRC03_006565 [Tulasnella sp. 419]
MNMQTRLSAALAVMLLNTSTNSWPPITGDSWNATSLAEFWIKLHHLFTRSFHRLHLGFHYLIPASYRTKHPRAMRLLRRGTFFTLSGILHMAFLTMLPVEHHARQWMKPLAISTLKFYCSQPLGLGIEKVLVFPITKNLPLSARMFVQRSFVVGWLLWTSRWWADVWVALGMFVEKPVLFSPLRGLLYGQWILEQRKA